MKIIRPQNNTPTPKLMTEPQIKQDDDILVDDNTYKVKEVDPTENGVNLTIKNLMDEIIKQKDDKIQVTISLTKRQYDLYLKKGGEAWLKKALVGQTNIRKKNTPNRGCKKQK